MLDYITDKHNRIVNTGKIQNLSVLILGFFFPTCFPSPETGIWLAIRISFSCWKKTLGAILFGKHCSCYWRGMRGLRRLNMVSMIIGMWLGSLISSKNENERIEFNRRHFIWNVDLGFWGCFPQISSLDSESGIELHRVPMAPPAPGWG